MDDISSCDAFVIKTRILNLHMIANGASDFWIKIYGENILKEESNNRDNNQIHKVVPR